MRTLNGLILCFRDGCCKRLDNTMRRHWKVLDSLEISCVRGSSKEILVRFCERHAQLYHGQPKLQNSMTDISWWGSRHQSMYINWDLGACDSDHGMVVVLSNSIKISNYACKFIPTWLPTWSAIGLDVSKCHIQKLRICSFGLCNIDIIDGCWAFGASTLSMAHPTIQCKFSACHWSHANLMNLKFHQVGHMSQGVMKWMKYYSIVVVMNYLISYYTYYKWTVFLFLPRPVVLCISKAMSWHDNNMYVSWFWPLCEIIRWSDYVVILTSILSQMCRILF